MNGGRLDGRRIIVTGAASGMGRAIVELFHAEGARLALLDVDEVNVRALAAELGQTAVDVDVADPDRVTAAVDASAQAMDGVNGVVNAAGILHEGPVADLELATFDRLVAVNLAGPLLVSRAALPFLRAAERATVVNIASMAALRPVANMAAYSATKAGLLAMSHSMAYEWGPTIRVNVICPGFIKTPMTAYLLDPEHPNAATIGSRHALGRAGEPEEIARGALFLTSDESSYVSRTELAINGGTYR